MKKETKKMMKNRGIMSDLRQQARELIEQMPEEKLIYLIQIMQGINGLFGNTETDNKSNDDK